jgi:YegS/Rv2252/BmrU family lipid kinase
VKEGFRKIIVVGGDGTLNEVVNGLLSQKEVPGTEFTVGMIPVGTGNDWLRTYNVSGDYHEVVSVIANGKTTLQDVGVVKYTNENETGQRFFANMAGLGFDGTVAQKVNADKAKGKSNPFLYFTKLLTSLFSYKASLLKIIVDGREIKTRVFSMSVGIGQYNGGGMMQAPDAVTNDGLLDLTIIKEMPLLKMIISLRRLLDGTIGKVKKVVMLQGKKIRIESDRPVPMEADGESLGYSPFEFSIVENALRVITNK